MRRSLLLVITFTAALLFGNNAFAGHVQTISQQTAQSMCKDHGGGTTCGYCHADHCHEVDCTEKGKCYNTVVTDRTGPSGVGGTKPISTATPTGNANPIGPVGGGTIKPIKVAFQPPASAGTYGGSAGSTGHPVVERSSGRGGSGKH